MAFTKPQQRLVDSMRQSGQLVHVLHGGGWRLFDGTPIHCRTVRSLVSRGVLEPAGQDLLEDQPVCYRLTDANQNSESSHTPQPRLSG